MSSIAALSGDKADAAYHLSALFRSGRMLVDKDLSITEGTLALRRFGLIGFKYYRQLNLTHPVNFILIKVTSRKHMCFLCLKHPPHISLQFNL